MKPIVALIAASMLSSIPIAAASNVMTFDNLPPDQTYGLGSYTEDGITAFGNDFWNLPNGTLHLDVGGVPTDNQFYSFTLGGESFGLKSFDVVALGVPETAVGALRGYDATGQLIRTSDFSIATSRTLSFSTWQNLSRIVIFATGDIDDHFSIDNLTIAAVPEPATWALMIGGLAMTGFAARRRGVALSA